MNITQLKNSVLNPEGLVDVEFEHELLKLLDTLELFSDSKNAHDASLQIALCKELRRALGLLENKIARFFGLDYRKGTGGQILIELAEYAAQLLQRPGSNPEIKESVRIHLTDIKGVQKTLRPAASNQGKPAASNQGKPQLVPV